MTTLSLPATFTVSALRGEDRDELMLVLEQILRIAQARVEAGWDGPPTVVMITPSSEVLSHWKAGRIVTALARLGRKARVHLRLTDVHPPLHCDGDTPFYSIGVCGGIAMREFVVDPAVTHVTYHQLTAGEMLNMTEMEA